MDDSIIDGYKFNNENQLFDTNLYKSKTYESRIASKGKNKKDFFAKIYTNKNYQKYKDEFWQMVKNWERVNESNHFIGKGNVILTRENIYVFSKVYNLNTLKSYLNKDNNEQPNSEQYTHLRIRFDCDLEAIKCLLKLMIDVIEELNSIRLVHRKLSQIGRASCRERVSAPV